MTSRESHGLQVALILFVMVTVVLSITTYVHFRKSEERFKELQAARAQDQQTSAALKTAQSELQILKHVLGYDRKTAAELAAIRQGLGSDQLVDEVLRDFDRNMGLYRPEPAQDDLNYRTLTGHLVVTVQARNSQLADANAQLKVWEAEKAAVRAAEGKRALIAEQGQQDAQLHLTSVQQELSTTRTRFAATTNQLAGESSDKQKQYQRLADKTQAELEQTQKQRDLAAAAAKAYKERIETIEQQPPLTTAGEVTVVNERLKLVWINLGTADGLARQMRFSVYDQTVTGLDTAKPKGRIEVTRVTQEHLAEARVLENPLADPILPHDKIASPAFAAGRKTH